MRRLFWGPSISGSSEFRILGRFREFEGGGVRTGAANDVARPGVEFDPQRCPNLTAELKSARRSNDFFDAMTYLE